MSEDQVDARLDFPATGRNAAAILDVLLRVLPEEGLVLEIGSGSGQHAAHFAGNLPNLVFQPTDPNPRHVASIDAWRAFSQADNLLPGLRLDVTESPWPIAAAAAVLSCNVIHISPWEVALALVSGASRVLPPDGVLVLYGPFMRDGSHTAPSNARFDLRLRAEDPRWGVRDLHDVREAARGVGLHLTETVEMPANNLMAVFGKGVEEP